MTELTPQQQEAINAIQGWHARAGIGIDPFRLFGPAGTGKTTLAREVPAALGLDPSRVQYGAYTGKAASVLRRKGCTPASTLHSLVYMPQTNRETAAKLREAQDELAGMEALAGKVRAAMDGPYTAAATSIAVEAGWASALELAGAMDEVREQVAQLEREARTIGWEWNPESPLADADLLICDEVSMVDAKLAADIERFDVPVLVLGDPEQLEPVGGEGYYINADPDFALTEIHRQALDSPVLELATRVRTSTGAGLGLTDADTEPRSLRKAMEHDQVLCWKNATRWLLINRMRATLGGPAGQVVTGDRIMCLTNNRSMGVFNGQQFTVLEANQGPLGPELEVLDDTGVQRRLLSHAAGFEGRQAQDNAKSMNLGGRGNRGLFTFANAITVHKAQGSEWPTVYVVNEAPDLLAMDARRKGMTEATMSARRWLYTGISRASDAVTVTDR